MTDLFLLLAAAAAGALAGLAYFSLLRATLDRLPRARSPWRLMLLGYLARATLALAVFAVLSQGPAERLVVALVAFLLARSVIIRRAMAPAAGAQG